MENEFIKVTEEIRKTINEFCYQKSVEKQEEFYKDLSLICFKHIALNTIENYLLFNITKIENIDNRFEEFLKEIYKMIEKIKEEADGE